MTDPDVSVLEAKVLTVSDGVVAGTREDTSGAAVADRLVAAGFEVVGRYVVADGRDTVGEALVDLAHGFAGLIVTTGGTGFAPRDQTPEGTAVVLDREAPGLAEAMRLVHPGGRLSRAIAGTRGQALIVNTPGSPKAAVEYVDAVIDAPSGWTAGPNAYLGFGTTYAEELDIARDLGWPHATLDAGHLHFMHDPQTVAARIEALAAAALAAWEERRS